MRLQFPRCSPQFHIFTLRRNETGLAWERCWRYWLRWLVWLLAKGAILNYAVILVLGIVSDLVRNACGGDTLKGVRTAYPIFALVPFGRTMVLWTDRANELAADAEEMGATYSEAMAKVTPVWMLIVMLAVTILFAIAAERVTEKVMKKTSSALR